MRLFLVFISMTILQISAQIPSFTFETDLGSYFFGCPAITDWDDDGDNDLIVGVFDGVESVLLSINNGTNSDPVMADPIPLKAGGVPIALSAS